MRSCPWQRLGGASWWLLEWEVRSRSWHSLSHTALLQCLKILRPRGSLPALGQLQWNLLQIHQHTGKAWEETRDTGMKGTSCDTDSTAWVRSPSVQGQLSSQGLHGISISTGTIVQPRSPWDPHQHRDNCPVKVTVGRGRAGDSPTAQRLPW